MYKRVIIILGIFFTLSFSITVIQSCCTIEAIDYNLESISIELKRIVGLERKGTLKIAHYLVDTFNQKENSIRFDSLIIQINNEVLYADSKKNVLKDFGFTSLIACSPAENFDKLIDIKITSNKDYNDSFPKGSDLKEIMLVHGAYETYGYRVSSFMIDKEMDFSTFIFTFFESPSDNNYHDITFKYTLDNGKIMETTVNKILITK